MDRSSDERYIQIVPSPRQLRHQCLEFYAFFHFTINTNTNREWGDGMESPELFHPVDFDAVQWVVAVKRAGMKGAILTCKHHDGFCLWPSRGTSHTIAASPYKNGEGDIVGEVSKACRDAGLAFGIYISPWDRNHPSYGSGKAYDDYFINQLEELLTGYGKIFTVWLDGACGEGSNGKKQAYDWERYYERIRELQPNACISVCGPDVRWCGNEAGDVRESEWSVVPKRLSRAEIIQAASQQEDSESFRDKRLKSSNQDLGSRAVLEQEELIWYPAEVNVSIRPGWFYHPEEDGQIRSLEELLTIYYGSVGGNSTFLLNVPPMPNGLLHSADVERLKELGDYLRRAFQYNLVSGARLEADTMHSHYPVEGIRKDDYDFWYQPKEGCTQSDIVITFEREETIQYVVLKEQISLSQRVEAFQIFIGGTEQLKLVYEGSVIGYKKIIPLKEQKGSRVLVRILDSRVCPAISFIGCYIAI